MHPSRLENSRGVALPMAIFALVVIGVLVGASFYIGRQEQAVGRNTVRLQQAFASAEGGLQLQVANWDPSVYNMMAVGDSAAFGGTITGSGWYRGNVRRLNTLLFLARSEGFSTDSTSRQQIGMLLRLRPVELDITAALKTQGEVQIGGSSFTDGNDNLPSGWSDCPALEPPLPGIQLPDSTELSMLDKTLPTNDCSMCILSPKMVEVDNHPNVELVTYSELKEIRGEAGDFQVTVTKKSRFLDPVKCTGCGACAEACVQKGKAPNAFQAGLSKRGATCRHTGRSTPGP